MPKLTKEERAELERQLKEDDEAADYDPEVTVSHSDGSSERMPYSLARHHHPHRFKDPEPPKPAKDDDGKDKDGGEVKRFSSGRRIS